MTFYNWLIGNMMIVWSHYENYTPNPEQIATDGFIAFSGNTRYIKQHIVYNMLGRMSKNRSSFRTSSM